MLEDLRGMVSELCSVSRFIPQCKGVQIILLFAGYVIIRLCVFGLCMIVNVLALLFFAGLMFETTDIYVIYFALEATSLISYFGLGLNVRGRSGVESLLNYFIVGFLSSLFLQAAFVSFSL